MSMKYCCLCTLLLTLLSLARVQAQGSMPYADGGLNASVPVGSMPPLAGPGAPPVGLSRWIVGTCPDCCGPLSGRLPIMTELYFYSGISFPGGDGQMKDSVEMGWAIGGGGRVLCFNQEGTAAWVVDAGLSNIHNSGENPAPRLTLLNLTINDPLQGNVNLPFLPVTVRSLNRTFFNLGIGRDWWLYGAAPGTPQNAPNGLAWRVGVDGGGRWGTAKLELVEFRHRTDTIGGMFLGFHSDVEIPCGCCIFHAGIRTEIDYTWSDILQIQNKSDLTGLNLLFTVGVRY